MSGNFSEVKFLLQIMLISIFCRVIMRIRDSVLHKLVIHKWNFSFGHNLNIIFVPPNPRKNKIPRDKDRMTLVEKNSVPLVDLLL